MIAKIAQYCLLTASLSIKTVEYTTQVRQIAKLQDSVKTFSIPKIDTIERDCICKPETVIVLHEIYHEKDTCIGKVASTSITSSDNAYYDSARKMTVQPFTYSNKQSVFIPDTTIEIKRSHQGGVHIEVK